MKVSEMIRRLQVIEADGHGDANFTIPDFSTMASHTGDCDYYGQGSVRDGEYAPEILRLRPRADWRLRDTVVCE